ncbi:zinc-binding protein A33-like [Scyliorhinus canicula]|uniref:zinc-binding protein A33-like n=1 Tax=Scyliorhinus canicula TaxID=7830 RepID=UPI0018F2CBE5|nr:zinc-binding protein A33-like [Scyliorhinus canicula]
MAVSKDILNLSEELTCSVCQSVFVEPVRLDCEHNFCKSCIQKWWENQDEDVSCPGCQQVLPQRGFTPNKVLSNLCEEARQLEKNLKHAKEQSQCEEHGKKLVLFCDEDQTLLCADCKESDTHSGHELLSLQRAEQKYKDQLKSSLDSMENKNQSKSELKQQQEREISELEELTGSLGKDISAEFAKCHQHLEKAEKCLIEELNKQKEEDLQLMKENINKIEGGQTSLKENTSNLHSDFKEQDSITFLKELKRLRERNADEAKDGDEAKDAEKAEDEMIQMVARQKYTGFQGPFLYTVWKGMKQIVSPVPACLTLDPNSAHYSLRINKEQTTVCATSKIKMSGNNTKGFDKAPFVLASQGFTSGKHFWEVEVRDKTAWVVGVTNESANRKGKIELGSVNGYWALCLRVDCGYVVTESPSVSLTLSVEPRTIGVYLDYEGGQVIFYNGDDMSILHTFTDTFTEKLFPFFSPGKFVKHENRAALMVWH